MLGVLDRTANPRSTVAQLEWRGCSFAPAFFPECCVLHSGIKHHKSMPKHDHFGPEKRSPCDDYDFRAKAMQHLIHPICIEPLNAFPPMQSHY